MTRASEDSRTFSDARTGDPTPCSASASAGFTLIELLVSGLIASILMGAIYQVLVTNQRISMVQREQVSSQQTVRAGLDVLVQELREVSVPGGDLLTLDADRIVFRASRRYGVACLIGAAGSPSLTVWYHGSQPFQAGEPLFVFADGNPETAGDDEWISTAVQSVQGGHSCGDDLDAQRVTVTSLSSVELGRIRPGAAVRGWEEVEYTVESVDGEPYLVQIRDGQSARLVGPLESEGGLRFEYFDEEGGATTTAADVARIRVTLRTEPGARDEAGRQVADSLSTSVHPRN